MSDHLALQRDPCTCPDPHCPTHARCGACGGELIIIPGDPAFCESCGHDVMPLNACLTGWVEGGVAT